MDDKTKGEIEDLRELIRQLHEALKDGKHFLKELSDTVGALDAKRMELLTISHVTYQEQVAEDVREGLKTYEAQVLKAIKEAEDAVFARFDQIANLLITGKEDGTGSPTLMDYARKVVEGRIV